VERAKAEEALQQSEKKYRTLFTSINQGYTQCELIRNKEGNGIDLIIMEVNPTYEKQTGINKEMLIGKPLLQIFPSLDKLLPLYAAVVDNQQHAEFENYFEETDRWFSINVYPREKDRFAVWFSDITKQKQASQYARSLIEASLDPLVTISAFGKITDVNEASIKVTGIEREQLIDTDF
jgi:PAS domain S-box-containing protein